MKNNVLSLKTAKKVSVIIQCLIYLGAIYGVYVLLGITMEGLNKMSLAEKFSAFAGTVIAFILSKDFHGKLSNNIRQWFFIKKPYLKFHVLINNLTGYDEFRSNLGTFIANTKEKSGLFLVTIGNFTGKNMEFLGIIATDDPNNTQINYYTINDCGESCLKSRQKSLMYVDQSLPVTISSDSSKTITLFTGVVKGQIKHITCVYTLDGEIYQDSLDITDGENK